MEALRAELKQLVVDTLGLKGVAASDIEDDAPLFGDPAGLELDSLDALELAVAFEYEFGLQQKLEGDSEQTQQIFYSVASLAEFIAEHRSK